MVWIDEQPLAVRTSLVGVNANQHADKGVAYWFPSVMAQVNESESEMGDELSLIKKGEM